MPSHGSPAFMAWLTPCAHHNGLMNCSSLALCGPGSAMDRELWTPAPLVAPLNPQGHVLQDWIKGIGTLKTQDVISRK